MAYFQYSQGPGGRSLKCRLTFLPFYRIRGDMWRAGQHSVQPVCISGGLRLPPDTGWLEPAGCLYWGTSGSLNHHTLQCCTMGGLLNCLPFWYLYTMIWYVKEKKKNKEQMWSILSTGLHHVSYSTCFLFLCNKQINVKMWTFKLSFVHFYSFAMSQEGLIRLKTYFILPLLLLFPPPLMNASQLSIWSSCISHILSPCFILPCRWISS